MPELQTVQYFYQVKTLQITEEEAQKLRSDINFREQLMSKLLEQDEDDDIYPDGVTTLYLDDEEV